MRTRRTSLRVCKVPGRSRRLAGRARRRSRHARRDAAPVRRPAKVARRLALAHHLQAAIDRGVSDQEPPVNSLLPGQPLLDPFFLLIVPSYELFLTTQGGTLRCQWARRAGPSLLRWRDVLALPLSGDGYRAGARMSAGSRRVTSVEGRCRSGVPRTAPAVGVDVRRHWAPEHCRLAA